MYLFLLTIIPLTLLIFINSVSTYTWKNFIPQIVFALFAAAVFCGIKEFFIFSLSIKTESFFDNFAQIFLRDSVIPLLFLTICHLLLCRDENDYKTEAFFVLLSFFYSLYIPYFIIARHAIASIVEVFHRVRFKLYEQGECRI